MPKKKKPKKDPKDYEKPGPKSIDTPDVRKEMLICYEVGMTDQEVADIIGVTRVTINNWKKKDPAFFIAIKRAKRLADKQVQDSLYSRACGVDVQEFRKDSDGKTIVTKKKLPPDPTSMIFWLKNRQPERWRDKRETEVTGKGGEPLAIKVTRYIDEE